ncbi:ISxac3 transposase [Xanthomonas citri pv. malvacearum str. GSPB2388]|nr:ISxac3 transposase [Xanthomonas citri pv. malvacearum str. GSPB2388]
MIRPGFPRHLKAMEMVDSEVSMSSKRYTDEFKIEAVRQVIDRGFKVAEVAERLSVTMHSLYAWLHKFRKPGVVQRAEVRWMKAELRRVIEECDILKDDRRSFLACHGLVCSMSRRGNCHDNAPVESFFGLLKRERMRRRIYPTKDAARA